MTQKVLRRTLSVYGFGEHNTLESFRQACKRFCFTENLLPPLPKPAKPPKAPKPPKPVKSEMAGQSETTPEAKPVRVMEPARAGLDLLHKAVAQLADDDGWARLTPSRGVS
jgi:hypothetical protein